MVESKKRHLSKQDYKRLAAEWHYRDTGDDGPIKKIIKAEIKAEMKRKDRRGGTFQS